MDLKEFFKPTKWKLILTFFIPFYLTYTLNYQMAMIGQESVWWQWTFAPIPLVVCYFSSIYMSLSGFIGQQPGFVVQDKILMFVTNYILPILINYIIVCLLIYLYKKYKK